MPTFTNYILTKNFQVVNHINKLFVLTFPYIGEICVKIADFTAVCVSDVASSVGFPLITEFPTIIPWIFKPFDDSIKFAERRN